MKLQNSRWVSGPVTAKEAAATITDRSRIMRTYGKQQPRFHYVFMRVNKRMHSMKWLISKKTIYLTVMAKQKSVLFLSSCLELMR